ncbi:MULTISPECIES: SRPBCC domain-containing protein [unclassified Arthrobacter]|uniref:SRPBCC domain-containing protein n=1 Tax=unclassified Arthrobacter TaxID=235627 RepID=UPI001E51E348|nr:MULTISPECIES: SRPBCC domain-containing protein [unclassified Arthrobacter]MCC9146339.1 SRPBCC domain-containing protein [Arthrobacter sp. zg-Y919]MDK1277569.1 SRPBCC domain-containing protein [Arthrobacter sp. zg.Y919]WIB04052.1 SRPBCC domain-containing protein [Arthrobacter sp. zg-Y919]
MTESSPAKTPVPTGRIERRPDGYTLAFERRLDFPAAHIWDVLTNTDKVAHWLGMVTPGWQLGKEYRLDMGNAAVTGTVLQMSPGLSLQFSWEDPLGDESVLDWQVLETSDGALLQFRTHETSADFLTEGAAGWQGILEAFDDVAAGREPDRASVDQWQALRDAYAEQFDVSPTMGHVDTAGIVIERWYNAPVDEVRSALDRTAAELGVGGEASVDIADDGGRVRVVVRQPVTGGNGEPDEASGVLAAWHQALDAAGDHLAGDPWHPSSRRLAALKEFYGSSAADA